MDTYTHLRQWLTRKMERQETSKAMEALGLPKTSFYRMLKGEITPRADKFIELLEYMGVKITFPDEKLTDFELVKKVAAQAGAGSSLLVSGEIVDYYAFSHDFLRRINLNPAHAVLMSVLGNSMEPLIYNKDSILIDESCQTPRDGQIFVVGLENELLVKRIQKAPRGWLLRSENRDFADILMDGADLEQLRIYGKVVWFERIL